MKNDDLKIWDIWEANVPYIDDNTKSSKRPVLILASNVILVLKMTTHQHSNNPKPFEYEVMKWQDAGLTAKTFIQCDRFITLPLSSFTGKKYGRLTMTDIIGVRTMMSFHGLSIEERN